MSTTQIETITPQSPLLQVYSWLTNDPSSAKMMTNGKAIRELQSDNPISASHHGSEPSINLKVA